MSTILLVDDQPLCRDSVSFALRHSGYDVLCAADGEEAINTIQKTRPDLILLDVEMPGMDGLTTLRIVRRNPDYKHIPVILLTGRSEKRTVVQAAQCGVQGYLLKDEMTIDQVLAKVEQCLAQPGREAEPPDDDKPATSSQPARRPTPQSGPAPPQATGPTDKTELKGTQNVKALDDLSPVITKVKLRKLIQKGLELRPLGVTVHNVMAATGSSNCSADDVAKAVANDQALCIRLLKLANSSAYSRGHAVEGVKAAVARIGIQEVRKLVMTLGVLDKYDKSTSEHVDARLFWEHSTACGLIASAIARAREHKGFDDYFLWGAVHDVGRLILLDHVSTEYAGVWEAAEALALPLETVEPKLMLVDHCEILELALEHWKFPREFIAPVVNHHQSVYAIKRLGPEHSEAAATIALANRIAHALLLGSSGNEVIYPLDDLMEMLKLQPAVVKEICDSVPEETNDLKVTMLARADAHTWPEFVPMVRKRFGAPFRPLCVSSQPLADAYRIFCERIADPTSDEPPNVGVMYLRDTRELDTLIPKYEARKSKGDGAPLPFIILSHKGSINAHHAWLKSRPHVTLRTPVRIDTFLEAVRGLLEKTRPRREAGWRAS